MVEAASWFVLASRLGVKKAEDNLAVVSQQMTPSMYEEAVQRAYNFRPQRSPFYDPMGTGLIPLTSTIQLDATQSKEDTLARP
jgi:hypothetical protein